MPARKKPRQAEGALTAYSNTVAYCQAVRGFVRLHSGFMESHKAHIDTGHQFFDVQQNQHTLAH